MKIKRIIALGLSLLLFCLFIAAFSDLPKFSSPALITSAGQNAEVQMVAVLAKRAGIDHSLNKLATGQDLADYKSLLLVLGASLKGLGAAGLDLNKEVERVKGLIESSRQKNIPILCLHLGGEERRGAQSDQFIKICLPAAKMVIVVKSGNKDGLFTRMCQELDIPLVEIEKTSEALEPLKNAFLIKN